MTRMLSRMLTAFTVLVLWSSAIAKRKTVTARDIQKVGVECSKGKAKSCTALTDIAVTYRGSVGAVRWIHDEASLDRVALDAVDPQTREAATVRVVDPAVLSRIALQDEVQRIRMIATSRIVDSTILAMIAIKDQGNLVPGVAVVRLTDQRLLFKVAIEAHDREARLQAAERLSDEAFLARVALESTDNAVRLAAVGKLSDQTLLGKLARNDATPEIRGRAAEKIGDQSVLLQVAASDQVPAVRAQALRGIVDPATLAKLASLPGAGDDLLWQRARTLATVKAYDDYAHYVPQGKHLHEVEFEAALSRGDEAAIRKLCRQSPTRLPVREITGTVVATLVIRDFNVNGVAVSVVGHPEFETQIATDLAAELGLISGSQLTTGDRSIVAFGTKTPIEGATIRYVDLPSGKHLLLDVR